MVVVLSSSTSALAFPLPFLGVAAPPFFGLAPAFLGLALAKLAPVSFDIFSSSLSQFLTISSNMATTSPNPHC